MIKPHRHPHTPDMLSVEEARTRILSLCPRMPIREIPLLETRGLTLAADVVANFDVPPWDNSAMDGYAVRAIEVSSASAANKVLLPVSASIAAGDSRFSPLAPNTAARIMTGAPLPEGADAVVPFENTDEVTRTNSEDTQHIGILSAPESGENTRPAGEDIKLGETALLSGTVLQAPHISVAASLGYMTLPVVTRPKVAVLSTGNELTAPGTPLTPGKIYDSNAYAICVFLTQFGAIPHFQGIVKDTLADLREQLHKAASNYDLIVTSAGVSKGDYDVVTEALTLSGKMNFWSVRMRPAKPLAVGLIYSQSGQATPLLGLPGNPVSAQVALLQFGRPAVHSMLGRDVNPLPRVSAITKSDIYNFDGRRVYARVALEWDSGQLWAKLTGNQSSGAASSMIRADGFAICPHDTPKIPAGAKVWVELINETGFQASLARVGVDGLA